MNTALQIANEQSIAHAAELLKQGEIVAIPTETVYGIAADATNEAAVQRIFVAKGRPQDNPLIVHVANAQMLRQVVASLPAAAEALMQAFWPGALTLVLPKGKAVAPAVCAGLDTVAVRMPSHPVAQQVIQQSGLPLAAPSANLSGSPSPTNAAHVFADMNGRLPLILDGGDCGVGVESTVLTLATPQPMLLRPGLVTQAQLQAVLGQKVVLSQAILQNLRQGEVAHSPGMKYKHYAPKAEITLVKGDFAAYRAYLQQHEGAFALCFAGEGAQLCAPSVEYGDRQNPQQQAQALFSALRRLDELGAQKVFARCPQSEGVALAVYNRLLRAAAFRVVQL